MERGRAETRRILPLKRVTLTAFRSSSLCVLSVARMAPPSREEDSDAPEHPLPSTSFYSVEYPSYVSSMSSVPEAVRTLGGQPVLDQAFKKSLNIVELNFRPENLWSHPICGDVVPTGNLVLKVTKRRKKKDPNIMDVDADGVSLTGTIGEFKAEVVGSIPKTIRFRSISSV
jgi:general transcription factor 3C polypeptide 5 (transcription factor C subunit 1)